MEGVSIDRLKEQIEGLATSLLTLEVNTIIKPGMSAQKMADVPIALFQVAQDYAGFLNALPAEWKADVAAGDAARYEGDIESNGPEVFVSLGEAAAIALRAADGAPESDERIAVLARIKNNSRQLGRQIGLLQDRVNADAKARSGLDVRLIGSGREQVLDILEKLGAPIPFPPEFVTLLRKIWDIGTEIVVFQTVVQIDGDSITRVSPAIFTEDRQGGLASDAERAFVSAVHHEALATATAQWKSLFQLVGDLMGGLAKIVFPRV
jgi:hypothetical protein